jgi:outer membrane lipase/esterase
MHDLDPVARLQQPLRVRAARDDFAVDFDGDAPFAEQFDLQQLGYADAGIEPALLPVEHDLHACIVVHGRAARVAITEALGLSALYFRETMRDHGPCRNATTQESKPMRNIFRPRRALLATALAFVALTAAAQEQPFASTVFFGDSLTDSGYFRPVLVQQNPQAAILGRFTTNPGLVWAEFVADYYGTRADANGNGQTGTNYAAGGARVASPNPGPFGLPPSLTAQVSAYLAANGGRADPNALFTVWGGANDIFAAAAAPAQAQQIVGSAVAAQIGLVGTLQGAGARYVLVPTIPDIGITPSFRVQGPAAQAAGTQLSTSYNTALFSGLAANGLAVIPVDTFTLLREVAADPATFGFTNVTGTACQPQITAPSVVCNPANYVNPSAPFTYLFADGVHPTLRAHEIVGDLAIAMIEGPRQIGLLPHVASVVGRARADMVSTQMSRFAVADGIHWWADGRYDYQRYGPDSTADTYDGGGPTFTVGVDWTSGAITYGAFGGYGRQSVDWGLRRGEFEQNDATFGGYAGWSGENAWVNAQLSYTKLDYDLERRVPLADVSRRYDSSTDGSNVTAAVGAGWMFGDGALRHGPIANLVAQRIEIDGFAEDRAAESSSLAFPKQEFDSLIGSAGWQLSYEVSERFRPYVRLTWDREFEDEAAQAYAQAQSIPGSLTYGVPAVEFDDSYGTFTYGSRSEVFGLEVVTGSSLTLGHAAGDDTSLFVTVRSQF